METNAILQQFPDQKAATQSNVIFPTSTRWHSNYLEKMLSDAVEVLQIGGRLDMDELYEEYCMTLPRQQEIVEKKAPVVEKWEILLKSTKTPNLTAVASFLFSIPITNASVERVFSLMTAAWSDQRNRCSVELIKSEIQVKTNFEY
ncbi:hypothetical protein NFI96_024887, partial [Prochilodus magdalenae]